MTRLTDFFGAQDTTKKVQVLTSGTSWTAPANLLDGLVSVTMIGAGQARYASAALGGQGGSVITEAMVPVVAATAYTYAVGSQSIQLTAPVTSSGSEPGGNTVFNYQGGTLTAFGGGSNTVTPTAVDAVGANRSSFEAAQLGAGKYGCYVPWVRATSAGNTGRPESVGGGGIMIGGTPYGFGANGIPYLGTGSVGDNTTNYGKQGVIYLQWREQIA